MHKEYTHLQKDPAFKRWHAAHEAWQPAYVLYDHGNVQIGFTDGERMTSFDLAPKGVVITPDLEIFRDPDKRLRTLSMEKVRLSKDKAIELAAQLHQKSYALHPINRSIVILQHLECGQVYNITFVTSTFHTLNCKVDAASEEFREVKLSSLFDLGQQLPK